MPQSAFDAASRPVQTVLQRLGTWKVSGNGFVARCPAHEDTRPSLSVAEGKDGKALIYCHRGCSKEAVLARLGLTWQNLFVPRERRRAP